MTQHHKRKRQYLCTTTFYFQYINRNLLQRSFYNLSQSEGVQSTDWYKVPHLTRMLSVLLTISVCSNCSNCRGGPSGHNVPAIAHCDGLRPGVKSPHLHHWLAHKLSGLLNSFLSQIFRQRLLEWPVGQDPPAIEGHGGLEPGNCCGDLTDLRLLKLVVIRLNSCY